MDNISKVLAGVIGIAAILAFLTPSELPLAPEQQASPTEQSAATAPPPSDPAPPPETPSGITDQDLVIGQPTIDGNPVVDGNPFGQDPSADVQNGSDQVQQQGDNAPPSYQGYVMPQGNGLQQPMSAPPVTNAVPEPL